MYKKLIILTIIISVLLVSGILSGPHPTNALNLKDAFKLGGDKPSEAGPLDQAAKPAGYDTTKPTTRIDTIVSTAIAVVLSFLGVIFLVLMIYGGYLWMNARGNEDQVTKAKNLITAAIIGLLIVLAAYAITYFIVGRLGATTLSSTNPKATP